MASSSQVTRIISLALHFVAMLVIAAAIWGWIDERHNGGLAGSPVATSTLLACLISASIVAIVCKRYWIVWAVPFAAGVAGALGCWGTLSGPYGGILGFLVGCLVTLLPLSRKCRA